MKKIIIAGGTGFLGNALTEYFTNNGVNVTILTRKPKKENHLYWDGHSLGEWTAAIEQADVVINMAGKCVDCRYNEKNRKAIIRSRTESTNVLRLAIEQAKNPPKVWLNSSSATIYIHAETELMTEKNGVIGDDFSIGVCKQWEQAFYAQDLPETRRVSLRTSIVLGNEGGAFPKMKQITLLGLGGHQGNGTQKVSWIHVDDFCKAVDFVIQNKSLEGPVNITAPTPTNNKNLMKTIKKKVHMPFAISQPKVLLEVGAWLMRTETELLLKSRNVYPEKLINTGFSFNYKTIEQAIAVL